MAASHEETIREALGQTETCAHLPVTVCTAMYNHPLLLCPACSRNEKRRNALAALDALVADRRTLAERTREACAKVAERCHTLWTAAAIRALDVSALLEAPKSEKG